MREEKAESEIGSALLFWGALAFATLGQFYFFYRRAFLWDGVAFHALGAALLVAYLRRMEGAPHEVEDFVRTPERGEGQREVRPAGSPIGPLGWPRLALVALAFLSLFLVVGVLRGKPGSYWPAFWLWLGGIALYGAAFVSLGRRPSRGRVRGWAREHGLEAGLVLVLTLGGLGLRFADVATIPANLGGDEASQGLEALAILAGERVNMFATGWLSVPRMSFLVQAASLWAFGADVLGLRMLWVLVGTMTIPAFHLLVRRLFGPGLALLSTALLATYHYHIHYSRLGSNQVADPLFMVLALYFFLRGAEEGERLSFALSGLALGGSLYFYAGARLVPVELALVCLFLVLMKRRFLERNWRGLLALAGGFLVVGLPMLDFFRAHPHDFNARLNQVGILQSGWLRQAMQLTGRSAASLLGGQFTRASLAFNYFPDRTVWYGASQPLLGFWAGLFFILGLTYAAYHLRKERSFVPLSWFWLGVVAGGMLTESPPSSQRLVTLAPVACLLVALGLERTVHFGLALVRVEGLWPRLAQVLAVGLLAWGSSRFYFYEYTPARIYGGLNTEVATRLGYYLQELGPAYKTYFFGPPRMYYYGFSTIPFLARGMEGMDVLEPLQGPPAFVRADKGGVFVFTPERKGELALVRRLYPEGELLIFKEETHPERELFLLYRVEKGKLARGGGG